MTFKQSAKDVAKGLLVAFIAVGLFFGAAYIYSETKNEIGSLFVVAIAVFLFMWALKIAKGPKEVRIVK